MKEGIFIKLISSDDFNKLIEKGIIKNGCQHGNDPKEGKWSSGFYDVKTFERLQADDKENKYSSTYSKMQSAHVGTRITKSAIYIQEKYLKMI